MQAVSISQLRSNMKKYLDDICKSSDTIIVSRQTEEAVVMISLKEYNSMLATIHLSSSEKNLQRLNEAIEREKAGIFETHDLID